MFAGVCGFLLTTDVDAPFTHRQMAGLRRRGPDGLGFYVDGRVRMAHARLAVVGLDDRGVEPIENATHVLAFNGEIYNWMALRDDWCTSAYSEDFAAPDEASQCMPTDAHVLLDMWSRDGAKCLPRLHGFWAFAAYDKRDGSVTLCRDQLGIKPLYYTVEGPFKAASTIAALGHRGELDYAALSEYARYQLTFGDKTFFRGVKKVLPGQVVTVRGADLRAETYEDIWARPAERAEVTRGWLDASRHVLRECVLESTTSDAGFTTFCSGGLDSGIVTRLAEPRHAWHCNYSDPECNETAYARETWPHLLVHNASEDFDLVDRLRSIVEDFDELTVGSVILPLDELMGRVRARRDKVVLTGTGGDELFGGYVRYQLAQGVCLHENYRGMFERMGNEGPMHRFEIAHAKGADVYRFYRDAKPAFYGAIRHAWSDEPILMGALYTNEAWSPLDFDRRNFLPGLLNIDDKISGRHGVESRPSLLHQRFVRRMMEVDPPVLPELKEVGKLLAHGIVPDSVVHRTDKMGFTTPIGAFVNQNADRIREQVSNSRHRDKYDLSRVRWTTEPGAGKFDRQVFGLLLLDLWLNRYA